MDKTALPLMIEDAVDRPELARSEEITRLMLAFSLLLGRDGVWPEQQKSVLRTVARRTAELGNKSTDTSGKPMTMQDHRANRMQKQEIQLELEHLRRRLGMSNLKNKLAPPAWGKFWS